MTNSAMPPHLDELGDRLLLPWPLVDLWSLDARTLGVRYKQIEEGKAWVYGHDEQSVKVLNAARVDLRERQVTDLSTPHIRAILAVFRAFTTCGDDGRKFYQDRLIVPTSLLCTAAGINPRQSTLRRALCNALEELTRRSFYSFRKSKRNGDFFWIIRDRPLFKVKPLRPNSTDTLPREYEISLDRQTQEIRGALPLSGTILDAFDQGVHALEEELWRQSGRAESRRGRGRGLRPIDWALFLKIARGFQGERLSENGKGSVLRQVNRVEFLHAHFGAERVHRARNSGRYKSRLERDYLHAAEVLRHGGLVLSWQGAVQERRGMRDLFEPNPDMIPGLSAHVERKRSRSAKPTMHSEVRNAHSERP